MGDRANIVLNQASDNADKAGTKCQRIYLYTHWGGYELPITLQKALERRARWNDESYLCRIIFQQLLNGDTGTTGYGISTYPTDGGYHLLVVDSDKQTVHLEKAFSDDRVVTHGPWTFEQYVGLDLESDDYSAWGILTGNTESVNVVNRRQL